MEVADEAITRRISHARELAAFRPATRADWQLYERLKAEFVRDFPLATPAQYERAMAEFARICGV